MDKSSNLDIMARTIYGEARGESLSGKVAVANVVLNRAKKSKLVSDHMIVNICLKPYQFSCWNADDVNSSIIKDVSVSDPVFLECLAVAKLAILDLLEDNTHGSTHYHVSSIGFPESWKEKGEADKKPVAIIGRHSFYNNVK
jgi:N-acetylmuramoyl-L-alanine amidase